MHYDTASFFGLFSIILFSHHRVMYLFEYKFFNNLSFKQNVSRHSISYLPSFSNLTLIQAMVQYARYLGSILNDSQNCTQIIYVHFFFLNVCIVVYTRMIRVFCRFTLILLMSRRTVCVCVYELKFIVYSMYYNQNNRCIWTIIVISLFVQLIVPQQFIQIIRSDVNLLGDVLLKDQNFFPIELCAFDVQIRAHSNIIKTYTFLCISVYNTKIDMYSNDLILRH